MAFSKGLEPDEAYFKSIPFCAKILDDPGYIITPTRSREAKPSTEDSLFAETFKTKDTVPAAITVYKRPAPGAEPRQADEVRTFYSLGSGVNGHAHVCHGGMVAAIFDEVKGTLLTLNRELGNPAIPTSTSTAYMNVSFVKLIATPQTVVATARLREIKGRKIFIVGDIRDGDGEVLAKVDALWVLHRERL